MADLISRAAALEALGECPYNRDDWPEEIQAVDDWKSHKEAIESIPAVDAATVVRCKDCMYFRPWRHDRGEDSRCEFWNAEIGAEDYCSQAIYLNNKMGSERRDEDAAD